MFDQFLEDIFWCFETDLLISGRIIKLFSKKFQINSRTVVKTFLICFVLLLVNKDTAKKSSEIVLLLPAVVLSLFGSFNKIKIHNEIIFVYWTLCSFISIIDPLLEQLTPIYYLLKVISIFSIYLRPLKYGDILTLSVLRKINIVGTIVDRWYNENDGRILMDAGSFDPSSPLNRSQSPNINHRIFVKKNNSDNKEDHIDNKIGKNNNPSSRSEQEDSIKSNKTTTFSTSTIKEDTIYSEVNNKWTSTTKEKDDKMNVTSKEVIYIGSGDLAFSVDNYLSFIKSFTQEVSEYIFLKNFNKTNPVAFIVKTNAAGYIQAIPPNGIIEPQKTLAINIVLKPIPAEFKLQSCIVVIEFNTVPIGTTNFLPDLISGKYKKILKLRHIL
uniref:Major sperm protein n=1 Tax=Parastrongyloides trichosuri TaxID=131310 RepID=A0A0N4ZTB9_PARTI